MVASGAAGWLGEYEEECFIVGDVRCLLVGGSLLPRSLFDD